MLPTMIYLVKRSKARLRKAQNTRTAGTAPVLRLGETIGHWCLRDKPPLYRSKFTGAVLHNFGVWHIICVTFISMGIRRERIGVRRYLLEILRHNLLPPPQADRVRSTG